MLQVAAGHHFQLERHLIEVLELNQCIKEDERAISVYQTGLLLNLLTRLAGYVLDRIAVIALLCLLLLIHAILGLTVPADGAVDESEALSPLRRCTEAKCHFLHYSIY